MKTKTTYQLAGEAQNALPPHSIEAEKALLGSLIIDPDTLLDVIALIKPKMFYRQNHQWIYEVIISLYNDGAAIDHLTIVNRLEERKKLAAVGGEVYIIELVNYVPSSVNAEEYGRIIANKATRRRMNYAAARLLNMSAQEDEPIAEQLATAESLIFKIRDSGTEKEKTTDQKAGEYFAKIEHRRKHGIVPGFPTGFIDIDTILGGLKNRLYVVAGRTGMGKSSVLISMLVHWVIRLSLSCGLFSQEMEDDQIINRMAAGMTGINSQLIDRGQYNDNDAGAILSAITAIRHSRLYMDTTSRMTPAELRAKCIRHKAAHGLDIVVVDYLGLMKPDTPTPGKRHIEIGDICKSLIAIGKDLQVPIIAAAQIRRMGGKAEKRPTLEDLKDSGSIEEDAACVMLLHRDEYYNPETTDRPNIAEINIAKHRDGPVGSVDLFWEARTASVKNAVIDSRELGSIIL